MSLTRPERQPEQVSAAVRRPDDAWPLAASHDLLAAAAAAAARPTFQASQARANGRGSGPGEPEALGARARGAGPHGAGLTARSAV